MRPLGEVDLSAFRDGQVTPILMCGALLTVARRVLTDSMIRTTPWPNGTPCWADLTVADPERARAFYSAVLGWEYSEGGAEFGGYVSALRNGAAAAGIGPARSPGPAAWTVYLASDDADATAEAIREAGGTVIVEPDDVGPLGRMLVASDPTGAVFGVWQARTHIGASLVNEPGGITWEDLRSTDPEAARHFYSAAFGFEMRDFPDAGPGYWTFHLQGGEAPLGGLGGMMGDQGASHWVVYFAVEDADAAVKAAEDGGGAVTQPAFDTPFGRMAALADPFGAAFMIVGAAEQPQPDRPS